MYLNDFSVKINGKNERSGYVEMNHGETYTIVLRNNSDVRCDANVEIDGKDVGSFRVDSRQNLYLERSANEAKLFTFYKLGSSEAEKVGLGKVEKCEMGLIKVTFKPEKVRVKEVIKEVHHYHDWYKPWPTYPTWTTTFSAENTRSSYKKCLNEDANTACYDYEDGTLGMSDCLSEEKMSRGRSVTRSAGIETVQCSAPRSQYFCASVDYDEPRAGGTGMSGHSNQRFVTVADLDYDTERITEIFLRLIPVKAQRSDPTELKPVVKSTPIPPVLYTLL